MLPVFHANQHSRNMSSALNFLLSKAWHVSFAREIALSTETAMLSFISRQKSNQPWNFFAKLLNFQSTKKARDF